MTGPLRFRVLPGGRYGYYCTRADDCFPTALATVAEVPLADVPYTPGRERNRDTFLHEMAEWAQGLGFTMCLHRDPLPVDREYWVGLTGDHAVVVHRTKVVHDPNGSSNPPRHFHYGITLDREFIDGVPVSEIEFPVKNGNINAARKRSRA